MDDGNLDHYSNEGGVEKWLYYGHILRAKFVEFADGFDKELCEKEESEAKVLGLQRNRVDIY